MNLRPRPWLDRIEPYRPGRPAANGDGSMASNESPLGVSTPVADALAATIARVHRYPDPLASDLRARLGEFHRVDPEQILVGNGSDELIFLLALAYLARDGHAVCADPAYRIDEISTCLVDAELTRVPLRDWTHDLEQMAGVAADIAYVVNPHNPTGTVRSYADIETFVAASRAGLVVVDEAYVDFADDPDAITALPLVGSGRVAVLRTFSKVYGLAGLRIGYLVAPEPVVATLRKVRAPFSVGAMAQAGAVAALADRDHWAEVRAHTRRNRAEVLRIFQEAGYDVVPSQANFVLVVAPDEDQLTERLARHGITVRPGAALGLPATVRVSVPSDAGLHLLADAMSPVRRPNHVRS